MSIGQELINISDCSLLEANECYELSFKEKIEMCRLIDKLGVSSINLYQIHQKKIDRLLIKSICSAVKNASIAVPVSLTDEESVQMTWEALREAPQARLQVAVPVSSVQMEYLLHIKPDTLIRLVGQKIKECCKMTENVELIAQDATRSDMPFLCHVLAAAIDAGAKTVTLCDTAGLMMPEELSDWIRKLKQELPAMSNVMIGLYCSGEMNLADANAFSAIRSGIREIKASTCFGKSISLSNIVRMINVKGGAIGVYTQVGLEQIRRITGQVNVICNASGRMKYWDKEDENRQENDYFLSVHDSLDTVLHAAEKLGYDLNPEDQQKVWKCFCSTAEKKEHISLKELDAIIAAEAMQVPPAYHDVRYVISTGNQIGAMAHMKLKYHNQDIEGISAGDGAIDAAFKSVEQATGRHYELDDFQIQSVTEGREAMGETVVRLRWEGKLYSGKGISTDIVGAGIMAYINAVNKIVYEEEEA